MISRPPSLRRPPYLISQSIDLGLSRIPFFIVLRRLRLHPRTRLNGGLFARMTSIGVVTLMIPPACDEQMVAHAQSPNQRNLLPRQQQRARLGVSFILRATAGPSPPRRYVAPYHTASSVQPGHASFVTEAGVRRIRGSAFSYSSPLLSYPSHITPRKPNL